MYLCCCLFNFQHEFGHWLSSGIIQIRKHLVYLECTLIDSYNCKVTFKKAMTTLGLACVLLSSCQSTRPKVASETITDQTFSEGGHAPRSSYIVYLLHAYGYSAPPVWSVFVHHSVMLGVDCSCFLSLLINQDCKLYWHFQHSLQHCWSTYLIKCRTLHQYSTLVKV